MLLPGSLLKAVKRSPSPRLIDHVQMLLLFQGFQTRIATIHVHEAISHRDGDHHNQRDDHAHLDPPKRTEMYRHVRIPGK